MPAFAALRTIVDRIERITRPGWGEVKIARDMPGARAAMVGRLRIEPGYGSDRDDVVVICKEIRDAATLEARRRGEAERDRLLAALSVELNNLRAALPAAAASASIEIGEIARGCLHVD